MKKNLSILIGGLFLYSFSCVEALASSGVDDWINAKVAPLTRALSSVVFFEVSIFGVGLPLVVLWLVVAALAFTLYFRFINITGFAHALRLVKGDFDDPNHKGEVSHFQALATAVSGTVGVGNIGGVAVAISIGGPGATFWMILAGFLGMSTKFVECALGTIYRRENPDGSVSGGPMYYLERGLAQRGFRSVGRFLAVFYAAGIVVGCLGIGNMFQANQAYVQVVNVTGGLEDSWFSDKGWIFGLIMALLVAVVIIGGIKTIAKVTEKIVPTMAVLYCGLALVVIAMNLEAIPFAVQAIVQGAFSPEGVAGGALGAMIVGFQRAVFSNEAGIGSAAIAHSAVRTDQPVTEGFVALLEPFIDTVVVCTLSALVIITTMYYIPSFGSELSGIETTSAAFERNLPWSPTVIAIAAVLFAFSTMIAWAYYGLKGWTYLVGESKWADFGFKTVFCGFVIIGSSINLTAVLDFSDALVFLICVPNIVGLYLLAPVLKQRLVEYRQWVASIEDKP